MDDNEYLASMLPDKPEWQYHEICLWSPFRESTVGKIAKNMEDGGFDRKHAILIYEGKILDGRHRYLAAVKSGVDPIFTEFQGTRKEAVLEVTKEQLDRGHWGEEDINFFYAQRANALGVQERGGNGNNQHQSGNVSDDTIAPSQKDHADALGVSRPTIARWEKDRKEIMEDHALAAKATTPEGYKEAKAEVKKRRNIVVPDYRVDDAMGAIKGISELFNKRFEGTKEEAASVLVSELIKGCETDDIGLSIARDYVKWFMSMKEVMDIAEPTLLRFLNEQPNLKIVV